MRFVLLTNCKENIQNQPKILVQSAKIVEVVKIITYYTICQPRVCEFLNKTVEVRMKKPLNSV